MTSTNPFQNAPRAIAQLPRVVRLYLLHTLVGFALSAVFTGFILWFDVAGIGQLVANVQGGWIMGFVFFVLNGIVFASVQTGIVVMTMDYETDG